MKSEIQIQKYYSTTKYTINSDGAFNRLVDKKEIPTCNILGVNIAAINMDWLLKYLKTNVKSKFGNRLAGDYICVSNVHTTVTSYEDNEYCSVQNNALMAIPDGGPLATIGRRRGHNNMNRIPGPNLMGEVFEISAENGYRHFFYGSTEETLKRLHFNLEENYSGMQIAGMLSPPFRPLTDEEDAAIIEQINSTKPDFIWVGLGAPKQEKWMAAHKGKVNALMVGVGAGFDYFAGNIDRAPEWMQKVNLEWLYRLVQEPKRLFTRYMKTNTKFIWLTLIKGK
ncbi:WecB/TagA/CpsF family glycosyltransferase [Rossellomorea sp. GAMAL-10_SWC]